MAAAASLLEATKLPLRELRQRYTKSELAIMGWRSMEIAANMQAGMAKSREQQTTASQAIAGSIHDLMTTPERERELAFIEEKIGGFIWKAVTYDENGNETGLDLRKLTGQEMKIYLEAMGRPVITPTLG